MRIVMSTLYGLVGLAGLYFIVVIIAGLRIIPNNKVGIIERWWSKKGSLKEGIIALQGEAGFLPNVLRGGIHFKPGLIFKVHNYPLITIPQGQVAYIFARSGEALETTQLLGKLVPESRNFENVEGFLVNGGQKGPQRQILREGTYALNLAQFVVITKDKIHYLPIGGDSSEHEMLQQMQQDILNRNGFEPIIIKGQSTVSSDSNSFENEILVNSNANDDLIGVVTVQEGPSLPNGEIIAPIIGDDKNDENYHNNFQNPEKFLNAGGYKGRQLQVLTEGTYYINRLFATVEFISKTVIPVGFVGVVVSYTGDKGNDTSGEDYKHGELVPEGCKGVWITPLMPGKYPFNKFAGEVKLVPTTNIILKWHQNEIGAHKYDQDLKEVDLITKDAFQPSLPLSVVLHIDYKKAPLVIQRFGDMDKLVNQTLDPLIASYFKNTGQVKTLIELIQDRALIQEDAKQQMKQKFEYYNIELEEVLIGTPKSSSHDSQMEIVLDQLRQRQVAKEQVATFDSQQKAAEKKKSLQEAEAIAEQQRFLTESQINIDIESNNGQAEAKKAEQESKKIQTMAEAEAKKVTILAEAEAKKIKQTGEAEAQRIKQTGEAEAEAIKAQVEAYGGPQYQLVQKVITKISESLAESGVDIVPKTVVNMGQGQNNSSSSIESFIKLLTLKNLNIDLNKDLKVKDILNDNDNDNEIEALDNKNNESEGKKSDMPKIFDEVNEGNEGNDEIKRFLD